MENCVDTSMDFCEEDFNGFFYTNDKQIRKMDDEFILSKLIERYPDFADKNNENLIRQTLLVISNDAKLIRETTKYLDITPMELFSTIYRVYSFVFNSSYISKIQRIVKNKAYGRLKAPTRIFEKCKKTKAKAKARKS